MRYKRRSMFVEALQWDGTLGGARHLHEYFPSLLTTQMRSSCGRVILWCVMASGGESKVTPGDYVVENDEGISVYSASTFRAVYERSS